jgi:predicted alpha/beta superfamily hydrolase
MNARSPVPEALVLLAALAFSVVPTAAHARDAMITIVAHAPDSTPAGAHVFVSGNVEALGPWDPGRVELARVGELMYSVTLVLPVDFVFEYKLTRGDWETVEKGPRFEEIPNRVLTVQGDATVHVRIDNWRDQTEGSVTHTVTGDLRRHTDFLATKLGNRRTILVFLPPGYDSESDRRYPVLYMHDGQNLFDAATSFIGVEWGVDETVTRLVEAGQMEPVIVVGISNTADRVFEYTPFADEEGKGGGAELYADFVVNDLKPFIDATYRTLPDRANTGVAGSSLGGLVSLYLAWSRPSVFSKVAAMSTSYGWADAAIMEFIKERDAPRGLKLWLDVGTAEDTTDTDGDGVSDLVSLHRETVSILAQKGLLLNQDLESVEADGATHNERAWAARLPDALRFLFAPRLGE